MRGNSLAQTGSSLRGANLRLETSSYSKISALTGISEEACARAERAGDLLLTEKFQDKLRNLNKSLVLDMDDTLISNQILFNHSEKALADFWYDKQSGNLSKEELIEKFLEIDHANIEEYGYTPERWRLSAKQATEEFCGEGLEKEAEERANIALSTGEILPGVEKSLQALRQSGVDIYLKTKGCQNKQEEKLAAHRFSRFFGDNIEIVPKKDENTFKAVASKLKHKEVLSIGDSERSDILPAQNAGHDGILIDKGKSAWSYEKVGGLKARRAPSLSEALLLEL